DIVLEFTAAETKFARASIHRELILKLPVFIGNQKSSIADKIVHPHPGMPGIAPGNGHVPAQSHGVFKFGRDTEDTNDVSVVHFACQDLLIKREFISPADAVVIDSFYDHMIALRSVR